jgi:predicted ATPase/class 3 adenylate cyclase
MGTVTFLYTDIEGSTRLWEQEPAAMRSAIERHNIVLQTAIEGQGGRVFRTAGDAFCAVFSSAPGAVVAAVEAQRCLHKEKWGLSEPLQVRLVLHSCEAEEHAGDYLGAGLNRIGRLLAVCHGGQTLLSLATEELVRDQLPPTARLLDLGQHRLRDLTHPEWIFQLLIEGLPESFPPLKTLDAHPNNLPVQLTSFIGRQTELTEVTHLLAATHLLTLTGPGGTGKSRLALQAAAEVLSDFPDGAWLVELAPLTEPENILPEIASVLNIRELPDLPLQIALIDSLESKKMLLLLDNCEHLIEACSEIASALLHTCPQLRVIASSRETLGIAGETSLRVPSLSLPPQDGGLDERDLLKFEAVNLFIDRARAVQPGFALTAQNADAVLQICRRLDGIPLAIELAAARVKLFSPEEVAARLDNRFRLLTGGSRTALPRQQTLKALIDWSYELLSKEERALFGVLSVFAGGWTFAAAEAIFDQDVLEGLTNLVNKSLVLAEEDELERARRFRFLETIRQYASDRLLESGKAQHARDQHMKYFAAFASQADHGLMGPEQRHWIKRLEREHDNLRAALEWAIERDPDLALQLSGNLALFWGRRGYISEGRRWLHESIRRVASLSAAPGEATRMRKQAQSRAFLGLGSIFLVEGRYPAAIEPLETSIALSREISDLGSLSYALGMLGLIQQLMGALDQARSLAEESYSIGQNVQDGPGTPMAMTVLGLQMMMRGDDFETSQRYIMGIIERLRAQGNEWFAATALYGLGMLHLNQGNPAIGRARMLEGYAIFREMGDRQFTNITRSALADFDRFEGDHAQSIRRYQETAEEWRKLGNLGGVARCLECLAFVRGTQAQESQGQPQSDLSRQAIVLYGAANSIRQASGSKMRLYEESEYERELASTRALIEPADFNIAWSKGQIMNLDQAVAYALEI